MGFAKADVVPVFEESLKGLDLLLHHPHVVRSWDFLQSDGGIERKLQIQPFHNSRQPLLGVAMPFASYFNPVAAKVAILGQLREKTLKSLQFFWLPDGRRGFFPIYGRQGD